MKDDRSDTSVPLTSWRALLFAQMRPVVFVTGRAAAL
jgi:hypothetical protein